MIGYIRGSVIDVNATSGEIIVEAGQSGVGYRLSLIQREIEQILVGDELTLFVSTQVREDAINLYGFKTSEARLLFNKLIMLNKVGPKLALAILNAYTPSELQDIVWNGNEAALRAVSGIGKQLAAKLMIDLAKLLESCQFAPADRPAASPLAPAAASTRSHADTRAALLYLDYPASKVENVIRMMEEADINLSVEEEVRWAIQHM